MDTKALRQKILDLAIRGKLVPQDPDDEPASVLLEHIRTQKQQMVREGKLKPKDIKDDTIIFVGEDNLHYEKFADGTVKCIEDEIPFDLPGGWEWTRFGCVVELMSGTTYPTEKEQLSGKKLYIKVADMNLPENEYEIVTSSRFLNDYHEMHLVPTNSVIFPKRGGAIATNKKRLVLRETIIVDLNTMAFTPIPPLSLMFCYYWFHSIDLGKINSGSSVPQINNKDIAPLLFPVPPVAEQIRIVNAIRPALQLEQQITSMGSDISHLIALAKTKILDLAIRGQLVPQNPDDEPASVLLNRIRAEKDDLIQAGKIKRDKDESVIFRDEDNSYYEKDGDEVRCIDGEIPFDIPETWTFVRLKHIGNIVGGGTPKTNNPAFWDGSIPWITPADLSGYEHMYISSGSRNISEEGLRSSSAQLMPSGSILYSSRAPIGYVAIASNPIATNQGFKSIVPYKIGMNEYLYYCLKARTDDIMQRATGTTFKEISGSQMAETIIPLPPLNEQSRIVDHIKNLTTRISVIESALN